MTIERDQESPPIRPELPGALGEKYLRLLEHIRSLESVVVAFSGGVDSAFLLRAARDALGAKVRAVLGSSASVPFEMSERARRVAASLDVELEVVPSGEFEKPGYLANGPDRCYHCKDSLYELMTRMAGAYPGSTVLDGTNHDDLSDERPGLTALRERGVRCPLAELGWTKAEIRKASRSLGLETWDRPASPCLSSRIPHGTPVTVEALARIGEAERRLRALGFDIVRVRHRGDLARIEVPPERISEFVARRVEALSALQDSGYRHVTVDLAGYRMGGADLGAADRRDEVAGEPGPEATADAKRGAQIWRRNASPTEGR